MNRGYFGPGAISAIWGVVFFQKVKHPLNLFLFKNKEKQICTQDPTEYKKIKKIGVKHIPCSLKVSKKRSKFWKKTGYKNFYIAPELLHLSQFLFYKKFFWGFCG